MRSSHPARLSLAFSLRLPSGLVFAQRRWSIFNFLAASSNGVLKEENAVSSAEHYGYDDFIPAEFLF